MEKNKVLSSAFGWLFIGLALCFITSYVTTLNETIFIKVYGLFGGFGYLVYAIAELILAIVLATQIRKMSPVTAKILYLLYTVLTGLSISGLVMFYTGASVAFIFLVTALLFGIFAFIGKHTTLDLSKWWIYLLIGLIGTILLEIINIFLLSNTLNIIVCIIGIVIFCCYIAYDIQLALNENFLADTKNKGIYIAFELFLDFINLFLKLLRLFGRSDD